MYKTNKRKILIYFSHIHADLTLMVREWSWKPPVAVEIRCVSSNLTVGVYPVFLPQTFHWAYMAYPFELFQPISKPIRRTLTTWEAHNYGRWARSYLCGRLVWSKWNSVFTVSGEAKMEFYVWHKSDTSYAIVKFWLLVFRHKSNLVWHVPVKPVEITRNDISWFTTI